MRTLFCYPFVFFSMSFLSFFWKLSERNDEIRHSVVTQIAFLAALGKLESSLYGLNSPHKQTRHKISLVYSVKSGAKKDKCRSLSPSLNSLHFHPFPLFAMLLNFFTLPDNNRVWDNKRRRFSMISLRCIGVKI